MADFVGTAEIRKMLGGITRERVYQLARRPDFPAPIAQIAAGKIWERSAVLAWMERTGRTVRDEDG